MSDLSVGIVGAVMLTIAPAVTEPFLGPFLWYAGLTILGLVTIRETAAWLRERGTRPRP